MNDVADSPINLLSLCSGGAGLDLAVEIAVPQARAVCYVEQESFAIGYLAAQMENKLLAAAPIWTDVKTFDGVPWRGVVDILTAGYPCQPFSRAGKRRGKSDPRHLWPSICRIIGEVEPPIVFMENVPDHIVLGFDEVAAGLEGMGYKVAAGLFAAADVAALHERERLFILALENTAYSESRKGNSTAKSFARVGRNRLTIAGRAVPSEVPNSYRTRLQRTEPIGHVFNQEKAGGKGTRRPTSQLRRPPFPPAPDEIGKWKWIANNRQIYFPTEPQFCGVADGLARPRNHQLALLGNGVVPVQGALAFLSLWASITRN